MMMGVSGINLFSTSNSRCKKGNAFLDTLSVIVIIFIFGIVTVLGYSLLTDVNDNIQDSNLADVSKDKMANLQDNYPSFMDLLVLTALVLLWIVAVIMSFLIDSHPVFLVITLLLLVFVLFFAGILVNSYDELSTSENLDFNAFPITNWIIEHLVLVVLVIGGSIAIALYGKNRAGGL